MSNVNEVMRPAQFRSEDGPIPFVGSKSAALPEKVQSGEASPFVLDPDEAILDYDPQTGRMRRANGSESTASRWNVPSQCVPITGQFVIERTVTVEENVTA